MKQNLSARFLSFRLLIPKQTKSWKTTCIMKISKVSWMLKVQSSRQYYKVKIPSWKSSFITSYLLEDFKKGLETLGALEAIQKHPEQFRELFTTENIASVDPIFRIDFDEQGSNQRNSQELAIIHWRDYLQDCESIFQIDHLSWECGNVFQAWQKSRQFATPPLVSKFLFLFHLFLRRGF